MQNKNKVSRKAGFTLVEIMIVVAIIGLLAAMAIPNFVHANQVARTNTCINNLRYIDGAKQQWALVNRKQSTDTPTMEDLRPYVGRGATGTLPVCPDGGFYTVGSVGQKPTCSIPGHVEP